MAIKVGGTEVVDNNRQLKNIASIDSGTVTAFNSALNTDPTKGTLTKTFAQNETAEITLSSNVSVGPVVSATKEVPQTGISSKNNWDVNSTASNYDFHNTAANVTLTPSVSVLTDISNATFSKDFSTASQTTSLLGLSFLSNGTKMYVAGASYVYQYNLSTAWDLDTASYSNYSLDYSSYDTTTEAFFIKPDGTKAWFIGRNSDQVRLINFSYAGELNSGTISSDYFSVANEETNPTGLTFKSDGTKMYIIGTTGDDVNEYALSTAWDVTTASYTQNFSIASQDHAPSGISFDSTGTKMYMSGEANNDIFLYNLSTAWDVSTASYSNTLLDISPRDISIQDVFVGDNNSKIYVVGNVSNKILQFENGSTVLTLGSGSFASTDVGKRIVGNGGDVILTSTGGAFSTTGGSPFTDTSTIAAGSWQMFGLKSAGDVNGITISGRSTSGNYTLLDTTDGHAHKVTLANTSAGGDQGFTIDPNGLYLYTVSTQDDRVKRYDFGTPWDLSTLNTTATSGQSITTSGFDGNMIDVAFNPSGTKMYLAGQDSDFIYQWNLSTAWDLSTASYSGSKNVYASNRVNGGFNGIFVTPDGTKIYTVDRNTDTVVRWNFTATQDIVNISFDALTSVNSVNNYPFDIAFNPDGTAMYLSGNNSGFYKFNLSTPFELSSGFTHDTSFSVTVNTNAVEGFFIKPDETRIYTMYNNEISQWNIGSFTQPTAQYHVAVTNSGGQIDSQYFTDINSMTAAQSAGTGTVHYAVSTDGRTTWSVAKGTDGVRPIVRNNSGTWQYNSQLTSVNDLSSTSSTPVALSSSFQSVTGNYPDSFTFADSGNKAYFVDDFVNIHQFNLSTAYDVTTMTSASSSYNHTQTSNAAQGVHFKTDGTKFYLMSLNYLFGFSCSTAFDLSTVSYDGSVNLNTGMGSGNLNSGKGITFKPDGTKFYVMDDYGLVYEYSLATAWDITSTVTFVSKLDITAQAPSGTKDLAFSSDGTVLYVGRYSSSTIIYQYNLGTAYTVSTGTYANESVDLGSYIGHSFELVNDTNLIVSNITDRKLQNYAIGTSESYSTSATWANGTVNDELYTLQQALSVSSNRMDKTQLDAIPDANHFPTGTSLDLMIALRQDTAASTLPTSDGVTLNYDAAALNEGAVLGTDYDFFHPAANKVQIKSLAAQNLKVRVV